MRPDYSLQGRLTILTNRSITILTTLALLVSACSPSSTPESTRDVPSVDLRTGAAALYEDYRSALSTPRREEIAGFYHPDGALVVLNGVARRFTQAELQDKYQRSWSPPAFFAWDGLRFDSVGSGEVLVTGGFRWQSTGQRDTASFIYAALLVTVDSGMAIVFEHETLRPRP